MENKSLIQENISKKTRLPRFDINNVINCHFIQYSTKRNYYGDNPPFYSYSFIELEEYLKTLIKQYSHIKN